MGRMVTATALHPAWVLRSAARASVVTVRIVRVRTIASGMRLFARWSGVHAHLGLAADDGITTTGPVAERFPDLAERLAAGEDEAMSARLRRAESIGRLIGDAAFISALERRTRRPLAPARRGPKPRDGV